jgi:predicted nucleic acid-binding protein
MIYVDTSVLVALHTHERMTQRVVDWYQRTTDDGLATADWSVTEFASALAIKRRTGQLDTRQMNAVWRHFEEQCAADLRLLPVDRESFRIAAAAARRRGGALRAGDALHLAIARQAGIEEVATLDHVMQTEARALRMRVTPLN